MVKIILGATIQVILGTEESGLDYRSGRGRDILFVRVYLFQGSLLDFFFKMDLLPSLNKGGEFNFGYP
jgi:hypothetical protein